VEVELFVNTNIKVLYTLSWQGSEIGHWRFARLY